MTINPFTPDFDSLPDSLPVFPLSGVLLLPGGKLPLNIFETRYLKMIDSAMSAHRLIGIVQPREKERKPGGTAPPLFETGCAGRITEYSETEDGRYLITLTGICRFKVKQELDAATSFRQIQADWGPYRKDFEESPDFEIDRARLTGLLKDYFPAQELSCDWKKMDDVESSKLITCLSMVCPLSPEEKQALLEAETAEARADSLMAILEMAIHDGKTGGSGCSH